MERPLPPEEFVAARAYHQELQRVDAWMAQAERAWDHAHRTEAHWQEAWVRVYHEEDPIPYNPRDAVHQEFRAHWDEGMEQRRDTEVWKQLQAAGVMSDRTIARYVEDVQRFYICENHPETERYPYRIAQFAAQEKLEAVLEEEGADTYGESGDEETYDKRDDRYGESGNDEGPW